MSLYVLDTDTLTLFRQGHDGIRRHVLSHPANDLAVTVISVEEQLSGWYGLLRRAKKPEELARVYQQLADTTRFLGRLQVLSFTVRAIARYSELAAQRLNVGKMDLRIAAIVLEHEGILVTRNLRDFQRVPGLTLEDWTA